MGGHPTVPGDEPHTRTMVSALDKQRGRHDTGSFRWPLGLGPPEIILIILVLVLLFGAKKLPELARGSGRALRIFKAETKGLLDDDDDDVKDSAEDRGAAPARRPASRRGRPAPRDAGPAARQQPAQTVQPPVEQPRPDTER